MSVAYSTNLACEGLVKTDPESILRQKFFDLVDEIVVHCLWPFRRNARHRNQNVLPRCRRGTGRLRRRRRFRRRKDQVTVAVEVAIVRRLPRSWVATNCGIHIRHDTVRGDDSVSVGGLAAKRLE